MSRFNCQHIADFQVYTQLLCTIRSFCEFYDSKKISRQINQYIKEMRHIFDTYEIQLQRSHAKLIWTNIRKKNSFWCSLQAWYEQISSSFLEHSACEIACIFKSDYSRVLQNVLYTKLHAFLKAIVLRFSKTFHNFSLKFAFATFFYGVKMLIYIKLNS